MGSIQNLTIDEKWEWHAYVYGLRRAYLNRFEVTSPIDPEGKWYSTPLVEAAERFYAKAPQTISEPKPAPDVVRPYWRKIRSSDMTEAEHALADPEITRLANEARANIDKAVAKWKAAFKERQYTQQGVPMRPTPILLRDDDPAVQAERERLGIPT